jgi:uncharacterized integral membrane protein
MSQQPQDQDPTKPGNRPAQLPPEGPAEGVPGAGTDVGPHSGAIPPSGTPVVGADIEGRRVTRAGMVWVSVATALVVLVLLIVFILQNQDYVQVRFFGLEGAVSLGMALFIAAVGGGVLVAIAGAARIIQLRAAAHRRRTRGIPPEPNRPKQRR